MQKTPKKQFFPYFPISQFYQQKFGVKIYKIPVSLAGTCPNREGLKGMKTCIFCDEWGSAAYPEVRHLELQKQIQVNMDKLRERYHSNKFFVYFQAYTNTYQKVGQLKAAFDVALQFDEVIGVVIGTRPDCVSDSVFELLNEYADKTFVAIELGLQSFDNRQLKWMERGHTAEKSRWAIQKLKEKCPNINLGVHFIFGWPGETSDDVIRTAQLCNELKVDSVKLHHLHVLKNTPLADLYFKNEFTPITRELYSDWVILFLQHLKPEIAVHRLAAVSSRHNELIAPDWTSKKLENYQYIIDKMRLQNAYQGQGLNN